MEEGEAEGREEGETEGEKRERRCLVGNKVVWQTPTMR
jgi:hypothetical protein